MLYKIRFVTDVSNSNTESIFVQGFNASLFESCTNSMYSRSGDWVGYPTYYFIA